MPLSNVFRPSIPNPFRSESRRKNQHAHDHAHIHSASVGSATSDGVAITSYSNKKEKQQQRKDSNKSKSKDELEYDPSSTLPSPISATTSPTLTSSNMISQLEISMAPSTQGSLLLRKSPKRHSSGKNENGKEVSAEIIASRTSASCSPVLPSPEISIPPTPISPTTPALFTQHPTDRSYAPSPEPLTPKTATSTGSAVGAVGVSANTTATGGTGTIGSRFGSIFFKSSHHQQTIAKNHSNLGHSNEYGEECVNLPASHQGNAIKPGIVGNQGGKQIEMPTPTQEAKKKRLSAGSLHIPIGTFLSNTFRSRSSSLQHDNVLQQQLQQVQQQQQQQPQLPQRRKRKGLLPKLPKLDTRPKIIVPSSSFPVREERGAGIGDVDVKSKDKKNEGSFNDDKQEELAVTTTATATSPRATTAHGFSPSSPPPPSSSLSKASSTLLSPFYLPATLRYGTLPKLRNFDPNARLPPLPHHSQDPLSSPILVTGINNGNGSEQEEQDDSRMTQSFSKELESSSITKANDDVAAAAAAASWNWQQNSRLYHDTRWDDDEASVTTVDSDMTRLSNVPQFPAYPERNAYWQKHCRIRERRRRKHQQLQKQALNRRRSSRAINDGNGNGFDDEQGQVNAVDKLRDAKSRLRNPAERVVISRNSKRFQQQRDRYTTYAAYMAAMQRKAKDCTDRKPSLGSTDTLADSMGTEAEVTQQQQQQDDVCAPHEPVLIPHERLMPHPHDVIGINNSCDQECEPQVGRLINRKNDLNHGDGDESECQADSREIYYNYSQGMSPHRQRQPDSGILFVTSTTTTAEVYPSLTHDPQSQPMQPRLQQNNGSFSPGDICKKKSFRHLNNKTSTTKRQIGGGGDGGGIALLTSGLTLDGDERIGYLVASYFDKGVLGENVATVKGCGASSDSGVDGDELPDALYDPNSDVIEASTGDRASDNSNNSSNNFNDNNIGSDSRSTTSSGARLNSSAATSTTTIVPSTSANHGSPATSIPSSPTVWKSEQPRPLKPALSTTFSNLFPTDTDDATSTSSSAAGNTQNQDYRHKYIHRRHSSNASMNSMISITSRQQQQQQQQRQQQQESGNGHMLLMLFEGRMHYYKDGARKTGPEWDDNSDNDEDDEKNLIDVNDNNNNNIINNNGSSGSINDMDQDEDYSSRPSITPVELRSPHSPHSPRLLLQRPTSTAALTSRSVPIRHEYLTGRRHSACMGDDVASKSPPSSPSAAVTHHHHHLRSASSLGRMRGAKSRASISYSIMPTLATPPSPSTSAASSPTSTLLSVIKLNNHSASGRSGLASGSN
ncbi:hypothetical protein BGX27_000336 [Mortierella sp. AM989]|nr:hypothetical protein BGX27_000336 [Mortierella sp. AM989]